MNANILADIEKVTSIQKSMRSRESFPTVEAAFAKLESARTATNDFHGLPVAIVGTTRNPETGEITPDANFSEIYAGNSAILAYVGGRTKLTGKGLDGDGKEGVGIKAIVIFPAPTLDSFMATDAGKAMINKVLEKEIGLVAFRPIREFATVAEFYSGVAAMPTTVDAYAVASERSGGVDTETFDALWADWRKALKEARPAVSKLLPGKGDVLKAIRSKSFAESRDDLAALEEKGMFTGIAQSLIGMAKSNKAADGVTANPLDTTAIEGWLAGRDEFNFPGSKEAPADISVLDGLNLSDALSF